MTKVLFLINSLGGGGAERVLVNLVNNLDLNRYDVTIQTIFGAGTNRAFLNPKIRLLESRTPFFPGMSRLFKLLPAKLLYRYYIRETYDVVIAYMHGLPTKVLQAAPDSIPKIAWLHTDMRQSSLPKFFFSRQIVPAFSRFDRIVGVGEEVSRSFVETYGLKEKVLTCYNTNDVPRIHQLSRENAVVSGWSDWNGGIRLVSLGRLGPEKGYDRLLAVCARLRDDGISFRLLILGQGREGASLHEQQKQLRLEKEVIFGGYRENPFPFLRAADLFVCSSRKEGLNTAMSESIILGTPVISTAVSGASEVLGGDSRYGLLVDNDESALYEGLKRLLSDRELLEHYRRMACERAAFFDTKTTVKAVERLIDEVQLCRG